MQLPPRGPNGMIPAGPPAKLPVIDPPSLCEAGPCRHFHRVVSEMDAQEPLDGTLGPVREQVTRACYPSPGIELELGETPVFQCSKWEPDLAEESRLSELRRQFLKTPTGKQFAQDVATFEAANEANRKVKDAPATPAAPANSAEAGGGLTGVATDLSDDDIDDLIGGEA